MHPVRSSPAASGALILVWLTSCNTPVPPEELYPQHDPWLEGHAKVTDALLHELCRQHRSFVGVGDLPGGLVSSGVSALSRDGRRAAGKSSSTGSPAAEEGEGFTWTRPGSGIKFWPTSSGAGILPLGFYPGLTGGESEATAVSADGTVVVGASKDASSVWHAVRWTANGIELVPQPALPWSDRSEAFGVSGDGSVIAGMGTTGAGERGMRWTAARGTELLSQAPAGSNFDASWANQVSDDGTTIAGRVGLDGQDQRACVWKSATPGGDLTLHVLSDVYSEAVAISADGQIVAGHVQSDSNYNVEACWWQWDPIGGAWGPAQPLSKLAGLAGSMVSDVDAGGRVVGGHSYDYGDFEDPLDDVEVATVWFLDGGLHTPGPHDAWLLLSSAGIGGHSGWSLNGVGAVTIDPTHRVLVLAGGGVNPQGDPEGWVAHLPPWCLVDRPLRIEPNVPFHWPPWRPLRGGPIDPLGGGPPRRP
jgi:probable HAF family extracellular repeat protein